MAPLPFKIRSLQEALEGDVSMVPSSWKNQDGKFEILFPIALPDEGTFDWVEDFLEKHPGYTEVSDRKIVEWATGSGLGKPRAASLKNCNDKPDVTFGIQVLDELTPRKVLYAIAGLVPRNYVVIEVKSNLLKSERKELLRRFDLPHFRRVAAVVVGEPPESFKSKVQAALLKEKQEKLDAEWKVRKERRKQEKILQERQKASEAEMKEESEVKDEMKTEESKDVKEEKQDDPEEERAMAELDEEELKLWFLPRPVTDLVPSVFNSSFADFTLPSEEEEFQEIRYEWATEMASKEYMRRL